MIPLKLNIKNFLCYGEDVPTLDFEKIDIACLSGENGHGKTTILEAITWCLWKEGRGSKTDMKDEEYIRVGQKSAWVQLDFESDNQTYRVSRTKPVRGSVKLEFYIINDDGSLMPITGNTVKETESKIEAITKLDWDTFTNTSYMKQGDADRFTAAGSTTRKDVLAKILLLDDYQKYEVISKGRRDNIKRSVADLESKIGYIEQESESLADVNANLKSAEALIEKLDVIIKRDDAGLIMLERIDFLRNQIDSNQKQIKLLQTRLTEYEQTIRANQEIISCEVEIEQGFSKFESLKAELEESIQKNTQYNELQTMRSSLEKTISATRAKYDAELSSINKNIQDYLEPKVKLLPKITTNLQKESELLSALDSNQQNHLKKKVDEKNNIDQQINRLADENSRLRGQHEGMRGKFKMLESIEPKCPLCEQSLSHEAHSNLRKGYEDEGRSLNTQHKQNESSIKALVEKRDLIKKLIEEIKVSQTSELKELQNKLSVLTAEKKAGMEAEQQLIKATKRCDELQSLLKTKNYAAIEITKLKPVEEKLQKLNFNPLKSESINTELKQFSHFDSEHQRLIAAKKSLPNTISSCNELKKQLAQIRNESDSWEKESLSLEKQLFGQYEITQSEINKAFIQSSLKEVNRQRQDAVVKEQMAIEQIKKKKQLSDDIDILKKDRIKLAEKQLIYDDLIRAFGKDGVQALLVENALPRIEAHSNRLLNKLTNGRLSIRFQLMHGEPESAAKYEKLEIHISDELGTHGCAAFSGGESFRISFAIRIALSKLLADRSGVGRTMLFIDEGFGSQDKIGQELMIESVQALRSEFDKILVVTHIEEIKEAFPTIIEVRKTESGSTFNVV